MNLVASSDDNVSDVSDVPEESVPDIEPTASFDDAKNAFRIFLGRENIKLEQVESHLKETRIGLIARLVASKEFEDRVLPGLLGDAELQQDARGASMLVLDDEWLDGLVPGLAPRAVTSPNWRLFLLELLANETFGLRLDQSKPGIAERLAPVASLWAELAPLVTTAVVMPPSVTGVPAAATDAPTVQEEAPEGTPPDSEAAEADPSTADAGEAVPASEPVAEPVVLPSWARIVHATLLGRELPAFMSKAAPSVLAEALAVIASPEFGALLEDLATGAALPHAASLGAEIPADFQALAAKAFFRDAVDFSALSYEDDWHRFFFRILAHGDSALAQHIANLAEPAAPAESEQEDDLIEFIEEKADLVGPTFARVLPLIRGALLSRSAADPLLANPAFLASASAETLSALSALFFGLPHDADAGNLAGGDLVSGIQGAVLSPAFKAAVLVPLRTGNKLPHSNLPPDEETLSEIAAIITAAPELKERILAAESWRSLVILTLLDDGFRAAFLPAGDPDPLKAEVGAVLSLLASFKTDEGELQVPVVVNVSDWRKVTVEALALEPRENHQLFAQLSIAAPEALQIVRPLLAAPKTSKLVATITIPSIFAPETVLEGEVRVFEAPLDAGTDVDADAGEDAEGSDAAVDEDAPPPAADAAPDDKEQDQGPLFADPALSLIPAVPVQISWTEDLVNAVLKQVAKDIDRVHYLAGLGQVAEAGDLSARLVEENPLSIAPLAAAIETAFIAGDADQTGRLIERAKSLAPDEPQVARIELEFAMSQRRFAQAAAIASIIAADPDYDYQPLHIRLMAAAARNDHETPVPIDAVPNSPLVPGWILARLQLLTHAAEDEPVTVDTGVQMLPRSASRNALALATIRLLTGTAAPADLVTATIRTFLQSATITGEDLLKAASTQRWLGRIIFALPLIPAKDIKNTRMVLVAARQAEVAGDSELALVFATEAAKREPGNFDAVMLCANLHRRLKHSAEAIALYQDALKLRPSYAAATERLIALEFDAVKKDPLRPRKTLEGLLKHRMEALQRDLFREPKNLKARLAYASLLSLAENYEEAAIILEQVTLEQPDVYEPYWELLRIAQLENNNAAILRRFEAARAVRHDPRAIVQAAKALRAEGKLEEAQVLLEQHIEEDNLPIRREFVRNLFFMADFARSNAEARRWLAVYPNDIELRLLTAAACIETGDIEAGAYHAYQAARNDDAPAYSLELPLFLYAVTQKSGDHEGALRHLDPMFRELGIQSVRANARLGRHMFDQLVGDGVYPTPAKVKLGFTGPLVSVVMTTYNVSSYVRTAVRSILQQSYSNIELIIVDDCSTDDTPDILQQIEAEDPRVRIILKTTNDGTYVSKNMGILQSRGEIIALQDSDDWSHPDRIARSVSVLLANPGMVGLTTDWLRMTTEGDIVIKAGGQISHLCCISLVFRKSIIEKVGFFDSVRIAADLEFIQRIGLTYGTNAVPRLRLPMLFGRSRSDSLTASEEFGLLRVGFTEPRQQYHDHSEAFHTEIARGSSAYMPFPLRQRKFDAPAIIRPSRESEK